MCASIPLFTLRTQWEQLLQVPATMTSCLDGLSPPTVNQIKKIPLPKLLTVMPKQLVHVFSSSIHFYVFFNFVKQNHAALKGNSSKACLYYRAYYTFTDVSPAAEVHFH